MNICENSFKELLREGRKRDFIIDHCECKFENCSLPDENDAEMLIKAYNFYDYVACLLVEGVEFCTKSELLDSIMKEFNRVNDIK